MQLKKDMKLNQDFQVTLSDLQCLIREEINDFDKGMKKCINFEMRESEMEGVNVLFHLMGYKKFVEYLFDDFELYINMVFQDFEENYEFHFIRFWNLEDFRRRSMLQIDLHTSKWKAKIEQFKLLPNSRLFQKEIMKCQEIINDSYTIIESTLTKSIIVMNNYRDQDQTVFSMYHEDFFNLRDDMNDLKQKLITWMRNTEIEDAKIDLILNECKQNIKLNDAKNANNLELDDKGGNDVELDEGSSESFEEEEEIVEEEEEIVEEEEEEEEIIVEEEEEDPSDEFEEENFSEEEEDIFEGGEAIDKFETFEAPIKHYRTKKSGKSCVIC